MPSAVTSEPNGRGIRNGLEESAWTELNVTGLSDAGFLGFFRARIDLALDRYNRDTGLDIPVPNSPKTSDLIMKRYRTGTNEQFQPHFDSIHEMANRYLVHPLVPQRRRRGRRNRVPPARASGVGAAGAAARLPALLDVPARRPAAVSNDKYIASTYLLF